MTPCLHCGTDFTPRQSGGKAQRFCSAACRRSFEAKVREIGLDVLTGHSPTPALAEGTPEARSVPDTDSPLSEAQEALMPATATIPSPEETRTAGNLFDRMRADLLAATERCAALERSITEMEKEHADAIEDMIGSHESEVQELRAALQASERLNKYLDELLHVHEANGNIRLLASERVGTIIQTLRDAANRAAEQWARSESDALAKDHEMRRKPKPEPVTYEYPDGDVTVQETDRSDLIRRLEAELVPDDGLNEAEEYAETPPLQPGNIPQFLTIRPGVER